MRLSISSIAWTPEEEHDVAKGLQDLRVDAVELAPTKIWDDPTVVTQSEADKVTSWWKGYDIDVIAFQSMLFARPDLKLFESEENRSECLEYLKKFTMLAGMMGVQKMVFGSPKNRQRGEMSYAEAFDIAKEFFGEIAKVAHENGVVFCIEPNAPQYACDFVTTAREGADLVRAVNHPGLGLHLDTACMTLAGDDIAISIRENADILSHFHVSSPMLGLVESGSLVGHSSAARALSDIGYDKFISIEMRPGDRGTNPERVETAVLFVNSIYS